MTFLRKSIGMEVLGRAQRAAGSVTGDTSREALGAVRQYAGRAGTVTTRAVNAAGKSIGRRPGLSIAIGTGLGIGALAAAWMIARYRGRVRPEEDEHDPMRQRPTNARNDAFEDTSEDNPSPGRASGY